MDTAVATLDGIKALQKAMTQLPNIELVTNHHFSNGMYARELHIPKDTVLVGKVHKTEHFCFLTQGEMTIIGDGFRKVIKAPCIFNSLPGDKRAGFAHSDCIFVTVHKTDETDLEKLEKELVEDEEDCMYLTGNILRIK